MKKIIYTTLLLEMSLFLTTGCNIQNNSFADVNVYTTVYPIEYITEELYGENSNVLSVYPDGIGDPNNYILTKKQYKDYASDASYFIYNGLSNEKKMAVKFINLNEDLNIIDVTQGLKINYSQEELWLLPSNYLMMSQNIKNNLKRLVDNKYLKEDIEKNYQDLKVQISKIDADLTMLANNSNNNTLLVDDNLFKVYEKYGFNIISLKEKNISENTKDNINKLLNNKDINYIVTNNTTELSDYAQSLKEKYELEVISINNLSNLTEEERNNDSNYLTIMENNIELLAKETNE